MDRCIRRLKILFTLLLLVPAGLFAQDPGCVIKGMILDPVNQPLPYGIVVLRDARDSSVYRHTTTLSDGSFIFSDVPAGVYQLKVSYTGYRQAEKNIRVLPGNLNLDLGTIKMASGDHQLDEIRIESSKPRVLFKGDTTEYDAGSATVRPNDVTEDLLKKLPGFEVERNGNVKANGEDIKKVLVDGKEFFGNDPKLALKNLPADAIEKLQVYDGSADPDGFSEESTEPEKTLNILLKPDKKRGRFGKASAGYGTENRYDANFNYNKFDDKVQYSVLGMVNNINQKKFSDPDQSSSLSGLKNMLDGNSGLNNGVFNTSAGGFNYNREFSKKTELNGSYFFNRFEKDLSQSMVRQTITDSSLFYSNEQKDEYNRQHEHRLNLKLDYKPNKQHKISFRSRAGFSGDQLNRTRSVQNFNAENAIKNQTKTQNDDDGQQLKLDSKLSYKKDFKKKGRAFKSGMDLEYQYNSELALLNSTNVYYTSQSDLNDTIYQSQDRNGLRTDFRLRFAFEEPLGENGSLDIDYSFSNNANNSEKLYYDIRPGIETKQYNRQLSNAFNNDYLYHQAELSFKHSFSKSRLTIGSGIQNSLLKGNNVFDRSTIVKRFLNVLPHFKFNYNIDKHKKLRFRYSTSVNEPSLYQLQPVIDNRDPLKLYQGNPDLKTEYSQDFYLSYHSVFPKNYNYLFISLRGGHTSNNIANKVAIDSLFVQRTQPVNTGNAYYVRNYFSVHFPINPLKIRINARTNATYNRNTLFINNFENLTDRYYLSVDGWLDNLKKDRVDVRIGMSMGKHLSYYSVNRNFNNTYLLQTYYLDLEWDIHNSWLLGTVFEYDIYSSEILTNFQDRPLLSASLSKYFLKQQKGELRLMVFDILDQNKIINQVRNLNYIEDEKGNALGRFFILSFIYNLAKLSKSE